MFSAAIDHVHIYTCRACGICFSFILAVLVLDGCYGSSLFGNVYTIKMDAFLHWSCKDVAKWVESLGYPQYTACFTENFITGKKLIYVNCCYLPRLGITNFEDMKVISGHVRELLGITDPLWSRSIVLPPRDLRGLYLEEKSRTGQWANSLTYTQFLKDGNNCHSPASFPEFKQR